MREVPLFVPHGDARLAAILTIPEAERRGLVLMLTGGGLPHVIGSTLCARAAERLARHGLATIRLDYAGVGDSTGLLAEWSLADLQPAVDQANAALGVGRKALGLTPFAVAGSCIGARVALELARERGCVGAACLAAPLIDFGAWTRLRRKSRPSHLVSALRSNRFVRSAILRPLRRLLSEKRGNPRTLDALAQALGRARTLFLYTDSSRDHYDERVKAVLESAIARLPPEDRQRYRFRRIRDTRITAFDSVSPAKQALILDELVNWIVGCFGPHRAEVQAGHELINSAPRPRARNPS